MIVWRRIVRRILIVFICEILFSLYIYGDNIEKNINTVLSKKEDINLRIGIAKVLSKEKNTKVISAFETILLDKSDNEKIRLIASDALASMGESGIQPLVNVLLDADDNVKVRISAVVNLGKIGSKGVDYLIDSAEKILKTVSFQKGSKPFIDAKHLPVMVELIKILGSTKDIKVIPLLEEMLKVENIRVEACKAIGETGQQVAVSTLALLLLDDSVPVKVSAAEGLGNIKSKLAVPALIRSLEDSNPKVRAASATALGKIGDKRAEKPLKEDISKENLESVKTVMQSALKSLK